MPKTDIEEEIKQYKEELEKITRFAPTALAKFNTLVVAKILFLVVSTGHSTL